MNYFGMELGDGLVYNDVFCRF